MGGAGEFVPTELAQQVVLIDATMLCNRIGVRTGRRVEAEQKQRGAASAGVGVYVAIAAGAFTA